MPRHARGERVLMGALDATFTALCPMTDIETKSEPENELAGTLQCSICHELCNRPVTVRAGCGGCRRSTSQVPPHPPHSPFFPVQAICQHNFCLKCFQDHINKSKKKCCPTCRTEVGGRIHCWCFRA